MSGGAWGFLAIVGAGAGSAAIPTRAFRWVSYPAQRSGSINDRGSSPSRIACPVARPSMQMTRVCYTDGSTHSKPDCLPSRIFT